MHSMTPVPECPRHGGIPLMGLTDIGVCLGPHKSRTCHPLGQVPLMLPAGLARGQSKPQLQKTFTAFPSALIRLSCNCSHKRSCPGLPWASQVLCQAHQGLPEIKAHACCAAQAQNVTCGCLDQRRHRLGDSGQGHPAPGLGLVLQGCARNKRTHWVTYLP